MSYKKENTKARRTHFPQKDLPREILRKMVYSFENKFMRNGQVVVTKLTSII